MWCWAKIRATNHPRYYLAYFLLIVLMTVTHPVPLLIVLAIVGLDVAFVYLDSRWSRGPGLPKQILSLPMLCYVASCTSLIYVSRFTDRQRIEHNTTGSAITNFAAFLRFAKLSPLAIFAGPRWDTYCYRLCLYLILAGAVLIATKSFLNSPKERPRILSVTPWMTMTIFLPFILMVIPRDLNGSHFFADRLLLIVWMSGLLAASAHGVMTKASQMTLATIATLVMLGTLLMANQRLRPISKIVAQQRSNPFVERPGSAAIDFGTASAPALSSTSEQVSFNPYLFSHAQAFTDQDTVLLNRPWLDLPILPLAPKSIMLNNSFSPDVLNSPHELLVSLQQAAPMKRQTILSTAQFLIFASLGDQQEIVSTDPESLGWHCVPYSNGTICSRVQHN